MTKEELIELKNKISSLTEEEQKQRDLYLRKLALGEVQGPSTGYASIDKPWQKYYRKEPIKNLDSVKTIYDMIFLNNKSSEEAIIFLDGNCVWTFEKLKKVTDKCINSLSNFGIKEGDSILLGVTNTPELIATIIAIVSLGASAKLFDIRANENGIVEYANNGNCKYMIALDTIVLPKVEKIVDKTKIKKVFVMRPGNSLSLTEKIKYIFKNKYIFCKKSLPKSVLLPNDERFVELSKTIKNGDYKKVNFAGYNEKRPAIKIQSSGTTGKAKTIVHSEKSAVEFAKSIAYTDLPLGSGKTVLVALPPWIAYGIGDAILMSLALGSKVMLCADFNNDAVFRNIGKFTLSYAAPFHYRYIREHYEELNDQQKKYLSEVDCMITGGDKYSALENENDELLFGTKILNGYGNNEDWGALSVNPFNANKYGSVGIPKYGETTIIYDNEKEKELTYGQTGEICTNSKTCFLGYEENIEATNKVIKVHEDGKYYLHTGDYGYIDKDGYIHLGGRQERVITRLGFKISAYTIEDAITSLPYISECITVEVPDNDEEHVPMAFVVPEKGIDLKYSEIICKLYEDCKEILKDNEIPKYIQVVNELKYTDNNKYDFREYENIGKNYVLEKKINNK